MIKTYKSKYEFNELKIKLESLIIKNGMKIMARIDHEENARGVGMKINKSLLYIFGNPRNGTLLMNYDMRIGVALPIKLLIWEDSNKVLHITYYPISDIINNFNVNDEGKELAAKMDKLVFSILNEIGVDES